MGIEKLKGSLLAEAQEDADKIAASSQGQAKSITDEERAKCSAIRKEAEADVERLVVEQRNERLAWARLESKRIMAESREDAIHAVLDDFFDGLKGARKSPQYKKFMHSAVAKAAAELGHGVTVHIVKGDKALLPELKNATVVDDLKGLGGALVESADGKFRMDLTLESLFEGSRDEIRKQVYERLFGS
jgi:V/A-type H+/Na+-transporting ATPase subunit E